MSDSKTHKLTNDDRHSKNPKTTCNPRHSEKKEGAGKGNWGVEGDERPIKLDKDDPMYDSDAEDKEQKQ